MKDLSIFEDSYIENDKNNYIVECFSAFNLCRDEERRKLEKRYEKILDITSKFNRKSVSFQLSKKDALHKWLKYKEAFSAKLVEELLDIMSVVDGDTILDPFIGSGTTALVCKMRNINCIGYDILPLSKVAIMVKDNAVSYKVEEIKKLIKEIEHLKLPEDYNKVTPYIQITEFAYPDFNEKFIQYATDWIKSSHFSNEIKNLFTLAVLNSLEECSYTSKTGQYLSWDERSKKIKNSNNIRKKHGKKSASKKHVRKEIQNIQLKIVEELNNILSDVMLVKKQSKEKILATIKFKQKNVLFELAEKEDECIDGVITSPPYCNRYDYTRTYALELAYLGVTESCLKKMRQDLLSCTVESKSKLEAIKEYYLSINKIDRFNKIYNIIQNDAALKEIIDALNVRKNRSELNNNGVIRMVENYFVELAFIYAELHRICKTGATVAFVNDNVRFAGEIIPVDFMSTNFAEKFGFKAEKIYCIKQQKYNSSQQMAKYGKVALRKSITIWKKI